MMDSMNLKSSWLEYLYESDVGDQRGRREREKREFGVSRFVYNTDHGEVSAEPRTSKKYMGT